jgi:hypothetical protein
MVFQVEFLVSVQPVVPRERVRAVLIVLQLQESQQEQVVVEFQVVVVDNTQEHQELL